MVISVGISDNRIISPLSTIDTTRFIILASLFLSFFTFIGFVDHVLVIFEKLRFSRPDNSKLSQGWNVWQLTAFYIPSLKTRNASFLAPTCSIMDDKFQVHLYVKSRTNINCTLQGIECFIGGIYPLLISMFR